MAIGSLKSRVAVAVRGGASRRTQNIQKKNRLSQNCLFTKQDIFGFVGSKRNRKNRCEHRVRGESSVSGAKIAYQKTKRNTHIVGTKNTIKIKCSSSRKSTSQYYTSLETYQKNSLARSCRENKNSSKTPAAPLNKNILPNKPKPIIGRERNTTSGAVARLRRASVRSRKSRNKKSLPKTQKGLRTSKITFFRAKCQGGLVVTENNNNKKLKEKQKHVPKNKNKLFLT